MINMENPITDGEIQHFKYKNAFYFRASPKSVEALTNNYINLANIANNHIHDYGYRGYEDTIKNL